ncbi:MAG: DUF4390 domain-containing protein [Rudaea sp.]
MRLWKKLTNILCCIALAACAQEPGAIVVRDAAVHDGVLNAHLQWQPDADVLDALDHGIALTFVVTVRAQTHGLFGQFHTQAAAHRHLQLRYFPLSRQYQLRDIDYARTRSYPARALALAALEDLRLALPDWPTHHAQRYALQITLDRDALPGALRLPALMLSAWHISSGNYTWQTPAA